MSCSLIAIACFLCLQTIGSTPVYVDDSSSFPPALGKETRVQLQPGSYDNTKFSTPNFLNMRFFMLKIILLYFGDQ